MIEKIRVFVLGALALLLFSTHAQACTVKPRHHGLSFEQSIDHAEWIVRAKVYSQLEQGIKMQVLEYIKGFGPDQINIKEAAIIDLWHDKEPGEANYYGHNISKYWSHGNFQPMESDCKIHPNFAFGDSEYLIFGPLDYNSGFENITLKNDAWLAFVKAHLNSQPTVNPAALTPTEYIKNAHAIIRFEAEWKDNKAIWRETIHKGKRASYANMLFPSPVAYFDTKLNPNCTYFGKPRSITENKKYDWIYVIEAQPKKVIRHSQHLACTGSNLDQDGEISAKGVFSVNGFTKYSVNRDGGLTSWPIRDPSAIESINLTELERLIKCTSKPDFVSKLQCKFRGTCCLD